MVFYRRNRIAGGTYFFTVTLRDRRSTLLVDRIDDLRHALRTVKRERPFRLEATVILPDHLHAIWTLPEGDDDYSGRWRTIKAQFTRLTGATGIGLTRNGKGEYDLWQRRFWEHTIRNERDLRAHVDYIHFNPVKHGCVKRVQDWPHSTFHRYVRAGLYPIDWAGGDAMNTDGAFGE